MKGLITAAGLGRRFGAVTQQTNKGLLKIQQASLLSHIVQKFRRAGIHDISVVCGYQSEKLKAHVGADVNLLLNPFYEVSGILGSFWAARHEFRNASFVFTTSDHFLHDSVLRDCLQSKGRVGVVVQNKQRYTPEDSKVIIEGGNIRHFGKDIPVDRANGEFAGMMVCRRPASTLFFQILENMLEMGCLNGYVMDILNVMRDQHKVPIYYSTCVEQSRIEIDSVYDLITARKMARAFVRPEKL